MVSRPIIAALLTILLSSCGSIPFLSGGGPTVNSNALVGQNNTQQVVAQQTTQDAGRDIITTEKQVETKDVEEIKINNTNIPVWVILLLIIGWLLPTPTSIGLWFGRMFMGLFGGKQNERIQTKSPQS
jgi:hypothetical protein